MKYNRIKKLLICLLSVSITAGTITGCGKQDSDIPSAASSVTADNTYMSSSFSTGSNINSSSVSKSASNESKGKGSIEKGVKYLENLEYDNAILEFSKVIEKDSHNVKAIAGLYTAYMAKNSKKNASTVLTQMKNAGVSEESVISAVLDYADCISGSDTTAANTVRNAIGTVALDDNYDDLAKQAFTSVLENDKNNTDAINGMKKLEEKTSSSNNSGISQTGTETANPSDENTESASSEKSSGNESNNSSDPAAGASNAADKTTDMTEEYQEEPDATPTDDTITSDDDVASEEDDGSDMPIVDCQVELTHFYVES